VRAGLKSYAEFDLAASKQLLRDGIRAKVFSTPIRCPPPWQTGKGSPPLMQEVKGSILLRDGIRSKVPSSSSSFLSRLVLSDTKSMRPKYEPASEPLHISVR